MSDTKPFFKDEYKGQEGELDHWEFTRRYPDTDTMALTLSRFLHYADWLRKRVDELEAELIPVKRYGKKQMTLKEIEDRIDEYHCDYGIPFSNWEELGLTREEYIGYATGKKANKSKSTGG